MGISERKKREKAQKRELLIDVAEEVFFEKGYETATMDQIAERAEYSKGTLYLYFKNKEDLYIAISTRSMARFQKIINEEMQKSKTGAEKLAAIKNSYLQFFLEDPEHLRVMLHAFRSPPVLKRLKEDQETMQAIMQKDQELNELIASAIMQSAKEGTLKNKSGEKMNQQEAMTMVLAGSIILNGIFQQVFDMMSFWKEHIPVEPEVVIRKAYDLLEF